MKGSECRYKIWLAGALHTGKVSQQNPQPLLYHTAKQCVNRQTKRMRRYETKLVVVGAPLQPSRREHLDRGTRMLCVIVMDHPGACPAYEKLMPGGITQQRIVHGTSSSLAQVMLYTAPNW
jgi:hypothetical protein